jgi:hypothetical protein
MPDMNQKTMKAIDDAWSILVRNKIVQSRKINNRIEKANLSPSSLEDAKVKESVDKYGYYDVAHDQPVDILRALALFVKLGYVTKKQDRVYNMGLHYVAHPYIPYVMPSGSLGITSAIALQNESFDLRSSQYEVFIETATRFRDQLNAGKHPHITEFDFGVNFAYETEIYELENKYFDALYVIHSSAENRLIVELVEPFVHNHNGKDSKNWKRLKEIDSKLFLKGSNAIAPLIDGLEWKKKITGIIIHKDKAYTIIPVGRAKEILEEPKDSYWSMPNYLEQDVFSYENYLSRTFEDSTADYLREKYGYGTKTRFKPIYLANREIDVFAEKGLGRDKTICECKLRINNSPITMDELERFAEKIPIIRENESKRVAPNFHFWLVTNSHTMQEGVVEYAEKMGIEIMEAKLPANWKKRSDWSIVAISKFRKE